MDCYYIVLNHNRKEYWLAEPKYAGKIEKIKSQLSAIAEISYYSTSIEAKDSDMATEENRGYTKANYYNDWYTK